MKWKLVFAAMLCGVMLLSAGCAKEKETAVEPDAISAGEVQDEEPGEADLPEEEPEPSPYAGVEARVVSLLEHMSSSSGRFLLLGTLEVGTEADLERWYEAISNTTPDNLAYLFVSDMQEEGYGLSAHQVDAVVAGLKDARLDLLEQTVLGNPITGGSTMIIALDADEEVLWKVSFDSQWFIVELEEQSRVFDVRGATDRLSQMREAIEA